MTLGYYLLKNKPIMQVKICGMRSPENIQAVLQLPINYMGFIFYPKSPRYVGNTDLGTWVSQHIEQFGTVKRVGVFVNAEFEAILNAVHDYQLDYVQLHGNESAEYCQEIKTYWDITSMRSAQLIKAFSVDENFDFEMTRAYERFCSLFIFDTKAKGDAYGGTGQQFNWSLLEQYQGMISYLLSGGIGAADSKMLRKLNFKQMVGIDINSRFETAPGEKDVHKIETFLNELNSTQMVDI